MPENSFACLSLAFLFHVIGGDEVHGERKNEYGKNRQTEDELAVPPAGGDCRKRDEPGEESHEKIARGMAAVENNPMAKARNKERENNGQDSQGSAHKRLRGWSGWKGDR